MADLVCTGGTGYTAFTLQIIKKVETVSGYQLKKCGYFCAKLI
jgi:hypothetical protein